MAEKQSLASKGGALAQLKPESFKLPALFESPKGVEDVQRREIAPYVCFASPAAKDQWVCLTAALPDVREADQVLVTPTRSVKLTPLKFHLLIARQYWAHVATDGTIIAAAGKDLGRPYKEQIEAVIAAYNGDELVAANMTFKSTKCGAAQDMCKALVEAGTADWAKKSAAHELTLAATKPFMRFFGTVSTTKRTAKSSGMAYVQATVAVHPTTAVEWSVLAKYLQEEQFMAALQVASDRFERRMGEITALFAK